MIIHQEPGLCEYVIVPFQFCDRHRRNVGKLQFAVINIEAMHEAKKRGRTMKNACLNSDMMDAQEAGDLDAVMEWAEEHCGDAHVFVPRWMLEQWGGDSLEEE